MKERLSISAGLTLISAAAIAAPGAYQTEVISDNPYVYYSLGELSGTVAADASGNGRTGAYVNGPTMGVPGAGLGSDSAVTFTAGQYLDSTATQFGSLMANSSFEFVFRVTNPFPTGQMELGGTLNFGSTTAFEVSLNRNPAGSTLANSIRLYLRDESGIGLGAAFNNTSILDGEYHHLVFTYDSAAGADRIQAYVDGIAQTVTLGTGSAGGTPTGFADFTYDPVFASRNNRGTIDLPFSGTLDEVALYSFTLSGADAAAHYAALIPEPASGALLALGGLALMFRRSRRLERP